MVIQLAIMQLGFDLRPFLREETGVGIYLKNLLFHLAQIDRTNYYCLFSSSWKHRFPREKIPPFVNRTFKDWRLPVKLLNHFWQKWRHPSLDLFFGKTLDLVHSATPLILPTKGKKIITVHDLFFMDFPDQAGDEAGLVFRPLAPESFRRSDGIITFSSFTKDELLARFDVPADKVKVIPHGLDRRFLEDVPPLELKATRKRCRLPPSFLLFVGAQEPRKNLVRLVEALKILHLQGLKIPLLLVGPQGQDSETLRARAAMLDLGHWVMLTGYLPDLEVRHIYRLASAFVFPSLCEGFGLPLVEAMASGVPVAASFSSAIPEVCQSAAVYFRPEDPEDMAEKISSLLESSELRQELAAKGKRRALDFSWEIAAEETLAFYNTVVS
jgi:glycosyltransferase involved in cell wall biosynthesis